MSRRTSIAFGTILIFGALGVSTLFIEALSVHLACGPALSHDYDTSRCEPPSEHPSSKGYRGTVILGASALGMVVGGIVLIWRSRRLR